MRVEHRLPSDLVSRQPLKVLVVGAGGTGLQPKQPNDGARSYALLVLVQRCGLHEYRSALQGRSVSIRAASADPISLVLLGDEHSREVLVPGFGELRQKSPYDSTRHRRRLVCP